MDKNCYVYTNQEYDVKAIYNLLYDKIDVFKGAKVVIKPNWVMGGHLVKKDDWDYVVTHPTVIEAVLDIVLEKLDGTGEILIVDNPMAMADFDELMRRTKIREIVSKKEIKGTKVKVYDLRSEQWFQLFGLYVRRKKLNGDPLGHVSINLKEKSEFCNKPSKNYYGADYDVEEVRKFHNNTDNIYVLSKTILSSDIFINLPKLKTHRFAGITVAMKNLVGTTAIKNSLPHHTVGSPENGGDAYPRSGAGNKVETGILKVLRKLLKPRNPIISYPLALFKYLYNMVFGKSYVGNTIRYGEWHGNDTIWRTLLDLNKIILYCNKDGNMQDTVQRKYYCVVDGILAGEGNGPLTPDKKECGVIMFGDNPVVIDTVAATIMGFNYKKIPSVRNAYSVAGWPLTNFNVEDILITSNNDAFNSKKISEIREKDTFNFRPHHGWVGKVELDYNEG